MVSLGSGGHVGGVEPSRRTPGEKRRAVASVMAGGRIVDVARTYGVSRRTVARWVEAERGMDALRGVLERGEPDMLHDFPAWLRAERARLGATSRAIAEMSGVSEGTLSNIMAGRRGPSFAAAVAIIDAIAELDAGRGA